MLAALNVFFLIYTPSRWPGETKFFEESLYIRFNLAKELIIPINRKINIWGF